MLRDLLCWLLNRTALSVFLAHGFTPENILLFFVGAGLRDVVLCTPYLNHLLGGGPLSVRRARLSHASLGLRAGPAPLVLTLRGADAVLALSARRPTAADGARAWAADTLFLDMAARLARRSAGLRALAALRAATAGSPPPDDGRAGPHPLPRGVAALLHWLVCVEVSDVAVVFEDDKPHVLYRNLPGFGFTLLLTVGSVVSVAHVGDQRRGQRGARRVSAVKRLRLYFDPGVSKTSHDGVAASALFRVEADESRGEAAPALSYLPDGHPPILDAPSIELSSRLDERNKAISARFHFDEPLRISMSDLEFQVGLASILRIPAYALSKVARGAAEELSKPRGPAPHELIAALPARTRRRYLKLYRRAVQTRMKQPAAAELARFEHGLSLSECLTLRDWCEAADVDGMVTAHAEAAGGSVTVANALERAFAEFAELLAAGEAGVSGLEANHCWGTLSASEDEPAMVLVFDFQVVSLDMRSSDCGGAVRMTAEMRNSRISVYDTFFSRGALVVDLLVPTIRMFLDESHVLVRSHDYEEGGSFMTMRFRKDGLLSPALQSLCLKTRACDVFASGDSLKFILDFFVPVESPLANSLRRRCLKTVARARRERAFASNLTLPVRAFEQAPVLDVVLVDFTVHTSEKDVDSAFFLLQRDDETAQSRLARPTLVARFERLSIETQSPLPHSFLGDSEFVLECSPVPGAYLDPLHEQDPASDVSRTLHVEADGRPRAYDGSEQVASIALVIEGIDLDLYTSQSLVRASDHAIMRRAAIEMTTLYIGMPYSPAYRGDNYLDVSFGVESGVKVLAETASCLTTLIKNIVKPVAQLAESLASATGPYPGLSTTDVMLASSSAAYPDMGELALEWVEPIDAARRTLRRITGDTHVRLLQSRILLVRDIAAAISETASLTPPRRACLEISFADCFIRSTIYSSASSRIAVSLTGFVLDISRFESSARRACLAPVDVALSFAFGPSVSTDIKCDSGPIKIMAHTASFKTLSDLAAIVHAASGSAGAAKDDGNGASEGGEEVAGEPPLAEGGFQNVKSPQRYFSDAIDSRESFRMSVCCMSSLQELGEETARGPVREGTVLGLVSKGRGLRWRFQAVDARKDDEWNLLSLLSNSNLVLTCNPPGGKQRRQVILRAISTQEHRDRALWRFVGVDTRHVALQSASGYFLSVGGSREPLVFLSRSPSYFFLRFDEDAAHPALFTTLKCALSVPIVSLRYGGGGLTSPRGSRQQPIVSAPALLQLDVASLQLHVDQEQSAGLRLNFDVVGEFSLSYNDIARRNLSRIPVLLPWRVTVSGGQVDGNQLLLVHGQSLRITVSDSLLQKIVLSLRRHESVEEDELNELSFFSFLNCSDRTVRFRVDGDEASTETGPMHEAKAQCLVPFSLPESSCFSSYITQLPGEAETFGLTQHQSTRVVLPDQDSDHSISIHMNGFKPVSCRFGSGEAEAQARTGRLLKLKLVPDSRKKSVGAASAYLRIAEKERRGSLRLDLVLPVALKSHLPFPIELYDSKRAIVGRMPSARIGVELGLSVSPEEPLSFVVEGCGLSGGDAVCSLAELLRYASKEVLHLTLASASAGSIPLHRESHYLAYHSTHVKKLIQCVISAGREQDGRRILHFAPVLSVWNRLGSQFDVLLDDCTEGSTSRLKMAPKWVTEVFASTASGYGAGGANFLLYASSVKPGQRVAFMEASKLARYRCLVRAPGDTWGDAISFTVSSSPSPGKVQFRGPVMTSRGAIEVSGVYDERSTLSIELKARFLIRNCTGRPLISLASATKTAMLGLIAHASAVDVRDFAYFDEDEAIVGVQNDWAKLKVTFPKVGDKEIVRIPSSTCPSRGLQFVILSPSDSIIVIRPLTEVENLLPIRIQLDGHPKARKQPLSIAPGKSAAFHEPHQILDSVFSAMGSRKMKVTIESTEHFEKTAVLHIEPGIYSLALRRTHLGSFRNAKGLETNSRFVIVGIEFLAEYSGSVLRILESPVYGPALMVSNFSRFTVLLGCAENVPDPVCRAHPGGNVASFSWTTPQAAKRRLLYISLGPSTPGSAVLMPSFDGSRSADPTLKVTIPYRSTQTSPSAVVALRLRFARGNGFLVTLHVSEESSTAPHPTPALAESTDRTSLAVHCALPRVKVLISGLMSLNAVGLSSSMIRTVGETGRMELHGAVYGLDVKNASRKPRFPVILTRATRGRSVDARSPLISVHSTSRLPNTVLNPSNLLHFETSKVLLQPLVLNLESRFVDFAGMYFVRLVSSFRKKRNPTDAVLLQQFSELNEDEGLPAPRRMPLYFEGDVMWTDISVNFTFTNNGRLRVGLIREDTSTLSTLVRVLIVSALPPVKNANLRFTPPDVAYRVFLAGGLSKEIISSLGKQTLTILRQLIPNVALLTAIERIARGRPKVR